MLASACRAVGESAAACAHGAMQGNATVWYAGLSPVHVAFVKSEVSTTISSAKSLVCVLAMQCHLGCTGCQGGCMHLESERRVF